MLNEQKGYTSHQRIGILQLRNRENVTTGKRIKNVISHVTERTLLGITRLCSSYR